MKETDKNSHKEVMETMRDGFDGQGDACVGIFWYDKKAGELFGVNKAYACELAFNNNGYKTIRLLHRSFWKEQYHKAKAKGEKGSIYLIPDYTQIPRGRIFQREADNVFEIRAGKWVEEVGNLLDLVKSEFNLETEKVEMIYDKHWDIGHGWSEDDVFG